MKPRGVSTYVEVFALIAAVTGGSALVMAGTYQYGAAAAGPSLTISDTTIRQGASIAVERLTVSNVGQGSLNSFKVLTGVSAPYCLIITSGPPGGPTTTTSTCPGTTSAYPVSVSSVLMQGSSLVMSLVFTGGNVFTVGAAYPLAIQASSAAAAVKVVALPA